MRQLKSKTILDRKPNLKLCSNHFTDVQMVKNFWPSNKLGTAVKDGKGWYRQERRESVI